MPSPDELGADFVSIVVADGTRIHTQLLADALRNDRGLQVVAEASNSLDLIAAISRVPIDVAVIAHNLDDRPGRGAEVLQEIRTLRPQIKGVILLDSSRAKDVLECFRAGARGIFSKQERLENLHKCIRTVHEGQIWARSVDLDHALAALANVPLVSAINHKGIELLSARERQVIQHLAEGMTNREIAKVLELSPHTVKNYLFRIFDKLGVSSRTELLYLTMNTAQGQAIASGLTGADMDERAVAGEPTAQLLQGDYYCQEMADARPEPVHAYMWYRLAELSAGKLMEQIDERKRNVARKMTAQQIAEAESKAVEWMQETAKKYPQGARAEKPTGEDPDSPPHDHSHNNSHTKKMHAGAR